MSAQSALNFMKWRRATLLLSVVLLLVSIASLATRGLNLGLDFTGGTLLEVQYEQAADLDSIRAVLERTNYKDVTVQNFGSQRDVLIRMSEAFRDDLGNEVLGILQGQSDSKVLLQRSEFVGASVGEELRDQGGIALLVALFVVMAYVAIRFQFKFSVGAVTALFHDVIIIMGLFSLLQLDFDLSVLAALLAVIGYSLNDTIVVSDRIRENFRVMRINDSAELINHSLTQTLGRTLMTSLTTALVLVALMAMGGEVNFSFSLAVLVGVVVGTYSSIYVAANVLLMMSIQREDLLPPELEEVDDRP